MMSRIWSGVVHLKKDSRTFQISIIIIRLKVGEPSSFEYNTLPSLPVENHSLHFCNLFLCKAFRFGLPFSSLAALRKPREKNGVSYAVLPKSVKDEDI
jgi:hypothetical protein